METLFQCNFGHKNILYLVLKCLKCVLEIKINCTYDLILIDFTHLSGINALESDLLDGADNSAEVFESDELASGLLTPTYRFNFITCKLCTEVMRKVKKEVGRESSRVIQ